MRRLYLFALVALCAGVSLSGCSGSSKSEPTPDTSAEDADWLDMDQVSEIADQTPQDAPELEEQTDSTQPDNDVVVPPDVVIEAPIVPGAFLITEFMADPDVLGGAYEWIEFYNTTDEWLALSGCTLKDEGGESALLGGNIFVAPKSYAVLAYQGTSAAWMGTAIAGFYSDYIMENTGDEIMLECRGALIDKTYYGPGDAKPLVSRQLKLESFNATLNDDPSQWCDSVETFGDSSGFGTPGAPNTLCQEDNPCDPNPCVNPPQKSCDSANAVVLTFADTGTCSPMGASFTCDYAPTVEDCEEKGQVCQNAECITVVNPCDPDPCLVPPGDYCQPDLKTLVHYTGPGVCSIKEDQASCYYEFIYEDCSDIGKQCKAAQCVDVVTEAKPTNIGDVIVSEFMPLAGPEPDYGEWIELYNTTGTDLNMKTCALVDMSGQIHTFNSDLVIKAHDFLLLARSADTNLNYGLTPDYVYSGFLLDDASDYIIIKCGNKKIDELYYQSGILEQLKATQLDPSKMNYTDNDLATSWCRSQIPYGNQGRYGTPGAPNIPCTVQVNAVDWCRLRDPDYLKALPGTLVLFSGVIEEAGVTDLTPFVDAQGPIRAEAGYGPQNTDPATDQNWSWHTATGNPTWNGLSVGLEDADEYMWVSEAPALGFYDVAFRFSADEGTTWTYCDLDAGEYHDGSEDGYSMENAGQLFVVETIDPCVPNPCVNPPAGSCEEGDKWAIYYPVPGACTSTGPESEPTCEYISSAINCYLSSKVCVAGECVSAVP